MNFSTLVRAVIVYMKEHYPTSPEEFNFQAELKAACHWHWLPEQDWFSEKDLPELASGPYDDIRVKTAAGITYQKWIKELARAERKKQLLSLSHGQGNTKKGDSSSEHDNSVEQRIFG